jgi:riboflavin kinase
LPRGSNNRQNSIHSFSRTKGSGYPTQTLILHGKVCNGKGEGTKLTELQWVKKQIKQKLGFAPYRGTLNIKLTKESIKLRKQLENAKTTEIIPENGYCTAKLFKAQIAKEMVSAVILPQTNDYPLDTLEIIASINLRQKLKLKSNDQISVQVLVT